MSETILSLIIQGTMSKDCNSFMTFFSKLTKQFIKQYDCKAASVAYGLRPHNVEQILWIIK